MPHRRSKIAMVLLFAAHNNRRRSIIAFMYFELRFKNISQGFSMRRFHRPFHFKGFKRANDNNAFAFLRQTAIQRVQDSPIHVISQFVLQNAQNNVKRSTGIVRRQLPNIFQNESARTFESGARWSVFVPIGTSDRIER